MSKRLYVATRKGLFTYERDTAGWRAVATHFLGDPVSAVLPDARDGSVYAALNLGHFGVKLRRARRGGEFAECAVPAYPEKPAGSDDPLPWSVSQIWSLVAGGADQPGVLWAGTIPGGLFRSADGGDSWELVRALWDHPQRRAWGGGGYDHPGIHSICVDPRDAQVVRAGVSTGGVWTSADGGRQWRCTATGMRAAYMPPAQAYDPVAQDAHRMVQCRNRPDVLWVQHHNGIFVSRDAAASWTEIAPQNVSAFGFAAAVHPEDPDTAWFVPAVKDECRVPVNAELVVSRTRDGGASFEKLSRGLPPAPAYDLVYRHGLDVDAAGRTLALGSTTGGLWLSEDGGERWQALNTRLPPIYAVSLAGG
ncbi:MAG TPA: hypothetical protein VGA00_09215 [Acidiferrobacterales bacterium]